MISTIELTRGACTSISLEDADLAKWNWCLSGKNTAVRGTKSHGKHRTIYLHRVIMERMIGHPLQSNEEVDHKDGDSLNNTRTNLRLATHQQNLQNTKLRTDNQSGYKGVSYEKRRGKWKAQITTNGKTYYLGEFLTKEEAHEAYECAAAAYFGEWHRKTNSNATPLFAEVHL